MRRVTIVSALVALSIFSFKICLHAQEISWQGISKENRNLKTVLIDPDNPRIIYVGTSNAVLKTEDGGQNWRDVLTIKGQNQAVYSLLFDPAESNTLYAATGDGLFYSANSGKSWNRVFKGKQYSENECRALAVFPPHIYLGTAGGLFISNDGGRSWHKAEGKIGRSNILSIACGLKEPDYLYVASNDGVFRSTDKGERWEKILFASLAEENNDTEEQAEEKEDEGRFFAPRYITQDPNKLNIVYLATSHGIYRSQDKAKTWDLISNDGLIRKDIAFLLVSPQSRLIAANKSGVFEYDNLRWQELSLGLEAAEISFLAIDKQNDLYAASDKGLFKRKNTYFSNRVKTELLDLYLENEPKIEEIQKKAVRYAEVEPEKIREWRKQAARRALLPSLSVGLDRDRNRTTSSSIWGIYGNGTTPGRYFIGPDDQTRYKNNNWSVTFTWELGDLIYNDDQTSIDVRSRLNTQLRADILDEITKLYFERLRIKMELDNLSIEDRKKRLEKELKLRELTALLDGLTGGYFSQHSNPNSS